jgi:hypothetical protein
VLAGLERGAAAVGFDINPKFVMYTRTNMEAFPCLM